MRSWRVLAVRRRGRGRWHLTRGSHAADRRAGRAGRRSGRRRRRAEGRRAGPWFRSRGARWRYGIASHRSGTVDRARGGRRGARGRGVGTGVSGRAARDHEQARQYGCSRRNQARGNEALALLPCRPVNISAHSCHRSAPPNSETCWDRFSSSTFQRQSAVFLIQRKRFPIPCILWTVSAILAGRSENRYRNWLKGVTFGDPCR